MVSWYFLGYQLGNVWIPLGTLSYDSFIYIYIYSSSIIYTYLLLYIIYILLLYMYVYPYPLWLKEFIAGLHAIMELSLVGAFAVVVLCNPFLLLRTYDF